MKSLFRSLIAPAIAVLAKLVLRKYRPRIVMVTGSVGKTSTKDALAAALSTRFFVRASEKSYNSEFGVPLTILGSKNPWTSPLGWLRVFQDALALLLLPNHYPTMLVLEVGADRPGDLERILKIAKPDAVVVTWLPEIPVHVEAYVSPEAVREEEFVPAYGLSENAPLVIASENTYARTYAARLPVAVSSFGFDAAADVHIDEAHPRFEGGVVTGMEAVLQENGVAYNLFVPGVLGRPQLLAPAAAFAAARTLGVSGEDALSGLASYTPPPGRMRVLLGVKQTLLIDDSYNASPAAAEEALKALSSVSAPRRVVVLGDMLELGRYSVSEHARIGALAASIGDLFISVGIRARGCAEAARHAGLPEDRVYSFDTSRDAAAHIGELLSEGDVVLVKGSQSIRMERIVEALLADKQDTEKLVRQDREWKRRP